MFNHSSAVGGSGANMFHFCSRSDPVPAWRPLPACQTAESVCCFKYARIVSADNKDAASAALLLATNQRCVLDDGGSA